MFGIWVNTSGTTAGNKRLDTISTWDGSPKHAHLTIQLGRVSRHEEWLIEQHCMEPKTQRGHSWSVLLLSFSLGFPNLFSELCFWGFIMFRVGFMIFIEGFSLVFCASWVAQIHHVCKFARWGPQTIAQLGQMTWLTLVYREYNYS